MAKTFAMSNTPYFHSQPPTRQKLDYQCLCKLSKPWHNKIPGNVHARLKAALYIMHCNSNRQVAILDRYTQFPCQTHERQYIFLELKWKPFNRYNGHNEFHFALLMQQGRRQVLARIAMRPRKTGNNSEASMLFWASASKPGHVALRSQIPPQNNCPQVRGKHSQMDRIENALLQINQWHYYRAVSSIAGELSQPHWP